MVGAGLGVTFVVLLELWWWWWWENFLKLEVRMEEPSPPMRALPRSLHIYINSDLPQKFPACVWTEGYLFLIDTQQLYPH
jgi:hypothetical protein